MGRVGRPRGEYAKSAERRLEILDATMAVFAESGFHGGTIRDIAERVGMSQAGLLHHFSSKQALLEAVLAHRDETALKLLGPQTPSGADMLYAFLQLSDFNERMPGLVGLFAVLSGESTAPDHPGHAYFLRRYANIRSLIERAIVEGQQDGDVRSDVQPGPAARSLIALWDGLQIQWLYEDGSFDMAGPLKAYIDDLMVVPRV